MKSRRKRYFPGVLILELYHPAEKLWTLRRPLTYWPPSRLIDRAICVPAGTPTDLASTGWLAGFLLASTLTAWAAIVHDYLYQTQVYRRRVADAVLREAMLDSGCGRFWAWVYWLAVRLFGGGAWASHQKDTQ